MKRVTSKDGTSIAYDQAGQGPALILVDGAFGTRTFGPNGALVPLLADKFSVITYDRRGRGESGDTKPYAVEREIEDLAAVIEAAGGAAMLYGISSGGGLVLEAVNAGLPVTKIALYEIPYITDETRKPLPDNFPAHLQELVEAGKNGEVVKEFMTKGVNLPGFVVTMMRFMPAWPKLKAIAPTAVYDMTIVNPYQHGKPFPAGIWSNLKMPALVISGGKSPAWMQNGMKSLAKVLPNASHRTLEGQTHIVKPEALAPVLKEFFS
ncbi:MAG: alpha/beta hydrolase [Chloroflexi bacterium]|nr:alpha/beta hydrolase [Chloroflexota bacterium]OJW05324.1 MAG: alpha/beta hydrolase [Chloroflexi bacterium 54-19]